MRQRTPQEKKALSYKKDRRNTYGENNKSSRNNIPKRKAEVNRVYRRKFSVTLKRVDVFREPELAEDIESTARNLRRPFWKKIPDSPLGEVVERKLQRRKQHAGSGKTARKKIRDLVAGLKIETERETDGRWIAEATEMNGVLVYGDTEEAAIERCRVLAGFVFAEQFGAAKILDVDGCYISVEWK